MLERRLRYDVLRLPNPAMNMPKAAPMQNPTAMSLRMSAPCSPATRGLSRLFMNGGNAIAKTRRGANFAHFERLFGLSSMTDEHNTGAFMPD
jgi:hypothetical protein